jgi:hypothetical protein
MPNRAEIARITANFVAQAPRCLQTDRTALALLFSSYLLGTAKTLPSKGSEDGATPYILE